MQGSERDPGAIACVQETTRYDGAMRRTRLESKPIKQRKIMPVTMQALADVRGGHSTVEPVAAFITFGGYDTTDG
jgi:hypothetical protein